MSASIPVSAIRRATALRRCSCGILSNDPTTQYPIQQPRGREPDRDWSQRSYPSLVWAALLLDLGQFSPPWTWLCVRLLSSSIHMPILFNGLTVPYH